MNKSIVKLLGTAKNVLAETDSKPVAQSEVKTTKPTFFTAKDKEDLKEAGMQLIPPIGGGVAGVMLWPGHRVLGYLAGSTLVSRVPQLFSKAERGDGLRALGTEATAIGVSLKSKNHPVLGYMAGSVIGIVGGLVITKCIGGDMPEWIPNRFRGSSK